MPRPMCEPCCRPPQAFRGRDAFEASVGVVMCEILTAIQNLDPAATGTRYDWELLCEPDDAGPTPVFVRFEYNIDGTILEVLGFLVNGDPFEGQLEDLVPCDCACVETQNVQLVSRTTDRFRSIEVNEDGEEVSSVPGSIAWMYAFNTDEDNLAYLKLYDIAGVPDPSSDDPIYTFPLPKGGGATFYAVDFDLFSIGIWARATLNLADTDDTAPASEVVLNLRFET